MRRGIWILAITAALLPACSTYHDTGRERLASLTQRYTQFDLKLAWETRVEGGKTLVDGEVQNLRYAFMDDLQIWVAVLDPAGRVVVRSVDFVIPHQLKQDDTAQFSLLLPVPVEPGTKLRFTYRYVGSDGGDESGGDGAHWMQSFEAVVPAR